MGNFRECDILGFASADCRQAGQFCSSNNKWYLYLV